jgi:hypothetical protein
VASFRRWLFFADKVASDQRDYRRCQENAGGVDRPQSAVNKRFTSSNRGVHCFASDFIGQHYAKLEALSFFSLWWQFMLCLFERFCCASCAAFSFFPEHMDILIPQSKCDQYRHSDTVSVAVNVESPALCPVYAARFFLALLCRASATEDTFVLQSISVGHDGRVMLGRVASSAILVAQLRRAFQGVVVDAVQYPLH